MHYVKFIIMVIISIDKLEYIYLIDYTNSYTFSKYAFRIEFSFFILKIVHGSSSVLKQ